MLLSSRAQPWSDFETFRAQAAHLRDGQGLPRFVEQAAFAGSAHRSRRR